MAWLGADAVPPLVKALADASPVVRRAAVRALGTLGATARPAESALVDMVNDPQEEVRDAAAKALRPSARSRAVLKVSGTLRVPPATGTPTVPVRQVPRAVQRG